MDPLQATMPVIMETSGISVNSIDGALFAAFDDAEEAREQHDEELEALEAAAVAASGAESCPEPTPDPLEFVDELGQPTVHRAIPTTPRTSIVVPPEGGAELYCSGETIESYEATE